MCWIGPLTNNIIIKILFILSLTNYYMFLSWILDEGTDFSTSNSALTFTRGTNPNTECITVAIMPDNDFEGSHNFVVSIVSIMPPVAPVDSVTTVFIEDINGKLLILQRA